MKKRKQENYTIKHHNRLELLDGLRGVAIIAMVVYHAAYNLIYIYGVSIPIFFSPWVTNFLHPLFAGLFLFLSGICCRFSKNNIRRGGRILVFAVLLSVVTAIFAPNAFILFGILHLMGVCVLLSCLVRPLLEKLPPVLTGTVFLLLFLVAYMWINSLPIINRGGVILFILGLPISGMSSADYFPILPWSLAFFSGACFGRVIYKIPLAWQEQKWGVFAVVGRYTLVIYVLHQPLLLLIMEVLFYSYFGLY